MKKFIVFLILSLFVPAFANEYKNAISSGSDVLVYFYSTSCISCKKFNPVYDEIAKNRKDIKCVKVNVETSDGNALFRKYHGFYIPYLILTSSKTKKTVSVSPSCAYDNMCLERVIKHIKS